MDAIDPARRRPSNAIPGRSQPITGANADAPWPREAAEECGIIAGGGAVMDVQIKDGRLIISIPLQAPTPSASGKTLVVATTHGNVKTSAMVDGKFVTLGVNAYIRPGEK